MPNNTEYWEEKTLDKVCTFSRGLTYSKKDEVNISNNIVLRANNIDLVSNSLNFDELKYIKEEFIIPEDKKVKKNSIMICISSGSKSHLGKVAFIDNDYGYAFGGFMGLITPHEQIVPKFLYYMLITPNFKDLILHLTDGANINNLKYTDLKDFKLNVPSLSEQQRIVEMLDEAFENIEKAKQNTLQNLNNAKELFENSLENLFTKNADEWTEKKLSEIGKIYTGTTPKTIEKDNFGNFIPFIKPADFNKDGTLNYNNEGLSEKGLKKARFIPKNSVLMVCIGATITKTSYTTADITCNQQINTLTPNIDNYKFIYYAMIRKSFKDVILSGCPQTTLPIINKTNWSELTIKLPDTQTQQKIVSQLDELQEQTKKLEQIYTQKLQDLDELKQSILQKAFNGEL